MPQGRRFGAIGHMFAVWQALSCRRQSQVITNTPFCRCSADRHPIGVLGLPKPSAMGEEMLDRNFTVLEIWRLAICVRQEKSLHAWTSPSAHDVCAVLDSIFCEMSDT